MAKLIVHNFFVCQQDAPNHLGALCDALKTARCEWTLFRADGGKSSTFDPDQHTGLIVLGGEGSSADAPKAYAPEKTWLRQAVRLGKPVLGICLGAQLLWHVCGGRLYHGTFRESEIGWKRVIVTKEGETDPVLRHMAPHAEMFQWHRDMCVIPSASIAENLANSSEADREHCEAFRIGSNAYGMQFHPEVTRAMLQKEWLFSPRGPKQTLARKRLDECIPRASRIARSMFDAWIQLAVRRGSADNRTV
jgi:GMP synthase-like glutamine amidotransferase